MIGHKEFQCFKKKQEQESGKDQSNVTSEVVLPMTEDTRKESSKFSERTWIADSGASCHMINDDSGMFKVKTTSEKVKIGQGYMTATKIGSIKR